MVFQPPENRVVQPQQACGINRRNYFGKRLIKFYSPGVSAFNPVTTATIKEGMAWNFSGTEGKASGDNIPTGRFTIVSRLVASDGGGDANGEYIYASNYNGTDLPLYMRTATTNSLYISSYPAGAVGIGSVPSGEVITVFARVGAQSVAEDWSIGYINASGVISQVTSSLTGDSRSDRVSYIGSGANGSTPWRFYTKPIQYIAVFDRILSDAEIMEFSKNPWQVLSSNDVSPFLGTSTPAFDLAGAAQASATATGAITSSIEMSGASAVIASANGAVNQSVDIAGAAASVSVADGAVSITTTLLGDGFVESFASGALASAMALEAAAQAAATAAADLGTGSDLSGSAAALVSGTGSIGLTVSLSGDSLIQALASANLDSGAANALTGDAAIVATASGSILQDVPILGSATITVTGSGGMTSAMQLEGAAAVSALGGGDLQVSALGLSANAIVQTLAGGSITMTMSVSAAALAQALAVGTLTVGDFWSGAIIEKYTATAPERNYTATA